MHNLLLEVIQVILNSVFLSHLETVAPPVYVSPDTHFTSIVRMADLGDLAGLTTEYMEDRSGILSIFNVFSNILAYVSFSSFLGFPRECSCMSLQILIAMSD